MSHFTTIKLKLEPFFTLVSLRGLKNHELFYYHKIKIIRHFTIMTSKSWTILPL